MFNQKKKKKRGRIYRGGIMKVHPQGLVMTDQLGLLRPALVGDLPLSHHPLHHRCVLLGAA